MKEFFKRYSVFFDAVDKFLTGTLIGILALAIGQFFGVFLVAQYVLNIEKYAELDAWIDKAFSIPMLNFQLWYNAIVLSIVINVFVLISDLVNRWLDKRAEAKKKMLEAQEQPS